MLNQIVPVGSCKCSINNISGGDRSKKREIFLSVLLSLFRQKINIPMILNLALEKTGSSLL